ncbi:hypothetical protein K1T71_012801 [Dendrolimus kikuchii]|uniref:Uncharacterized protein n=1 Tax=Dendrolimus kikuchii TaxID=765133 RepID=A0ACC1CI51_9NEOP|nr:hypothetical protein K1T71_012801 [Dendrolimus kikuchii]
MEGVSWPSTTSASILFCIVYLFSSSQSMFSYSQIPVRRADTCNICYGSNDCFPLERLMCEYYMNTNHLLKDDDEDGEENQMMKEEVDSILFGVVEKVESPYQQCLPFISSYSDCTKENVCMDCKTCSCDHLGNWNCTDFHCASDDGTTDVNHRVLVIALNNLENLQTAHRKKRSTTSKDSAEELSDLLYELKRIPKDGTISTTVVDESNISTKDPNDVVRYITASTLHTITNIVPDTDLAFDEVLNNLSVESKNNTRRKSLLDIEQNIPPVLDYMNIDDDRDDNFHNMLIEEFNKATESAIENATKIVIDLLEPVNLEELNFNDTSNNSNLALDNNTVEVTAVNIMKRDTKLVLNNTKTNKEIMNVTYTADEVQNNILTPLNSVINDKQKEVEELLRVRENLIDFIKKYHSDDFEIDYIPDFPNNNTKTQLSIYKLEIEPQLKFEDDLRSTNPNIVNKYLYKIKRDIYEVLRDIVNIQKYSDPNKIPEDFKMLIRAMKLYIKNNGNFNEKEDTTEVTYKKSRRYLDYYKINSTPKTIIDGILDIIKVIDKDMPLSNALAPLSFKAKKVMKRVIKSNYIDDFAVIGLRVSDPNYNLTNDLANVGNDWQRLTSNVVKSPVYDILHALKHLHYQLAIDTGKMNDAMNIIDIAYSRRVGQIEERIGEDVIERISQGLRSVNDKIQLIIKLHQKKKAVENLMKRDRKKIKKESFLKRLKAVLRNSKNDIAKLLRRKVPKSEIVKQIASNKLNDLRNEKVVDYEDTMRKWQQNLNLIPKREKRSNKLQRVKNRIKNILPKYLRGKVNPAIDAKKVNKSKTKHRTTIRTTKKHIESTIPTTAMRISETI